jgi:hypothetical protein
LLSELYRYLMLLLVNQVRDAKIKVLSSLKQDGDEERLEWKKLSVSLKVRAYLLVIFWMKFRFVNLQLRFY